MKFFKIVFGSCIGALLALIALSFLIFSLSAGLAGSLKEDVSIPSQALLDLELDKNVPELSNNVKVQYSDFSIKDAVGLQDIIQSIKRAKEDDRIKGIYMDISSISTGLSATSDVHRALLDFKRSGKPVFAYADNYTQRSYALATAADKIFINPNGQIDMKGFGVIIAFLEDFLDRIGVDMQIFYAGDYKSATEPFRLNKMSSFNREQTKDYLTDLYQSYTKLITDNRAVTRSEIIRLAEDEVFIESDKALSLELVDAVSYRDEAAKEIKQMANLDEDKDIRFVSIQDYYKSAKPDYSIKDKIAVVYAEGEIRDDEDENGKITYNKYAKIFKKLRKDKKVKAVVLRVNSPGGSALASDNIWRETVLLKEAGKPFVVSFGNVAASGGYYISAAADKILANENSITGSIGVFGMMPDAHRLFEEKLKIHFDTVAIGSNATAFNPFYKMTKKQQSMLQESVDYIYKQFIQRVAEGRKMDLDKVKEIARGRVYSGRRAKEIGLVDQIGNLNDAIELAAELANLEKFRTVSYPKIKDPIQQLIDDFFGGKVQNKMLDSKVQQLIPFVQYYQYLQDCNTAQARMPYFIFDF